MAYETASHLIGTFAWLGWSVRRGLSAEDFIRSMAGLAGPSTSTYQVAYETVGPLVSTFLWLEVCPQGSVRRDLSAGDFIRSLARLAAREAKVRIKWPTKL